MMRNIFTHLASVTLYNSSVTNNGSTGLTFILTGMESLTNYNISKYLKVSTVTSNSSVFTECTSLLSIDGSNLSHYNSTTHTEDLNADYEKMLESVTRYLWMVLSPIFILVGVFGNCVNFAAVWKMKFWRRTPLFLLAVLALTDITILLDGLLRYWIQYSFEVDIRTLSNFSCKLNLFVVYLSMQFSSWILVCMTVDRFLKTNFPFTYMRIVTVRKAYVVVFVVFLLLTGLNLHFFFTNGTIVDANGTVTCDDLKPDYEYFEEYIFVYVDFTMMSAIPFLIMVILNVFIFRALNQHVKFRRQSVIHSRTGFQTETRRQFSRKLTKMLLFVSFYFLISNVPISVYFIYDSYVKFDGNDLNRAKKDLAWTVLYLVQYSNYALNFVWYAAHNKVFREKIKEIIGFKPKAFRYQNTTRRLQQRSSTISHMTTSLGSSINEVVSKTGLEHSDYSEDYSPSTENINIDQTARNCTELDTTEHI